MSIPTVRFGRFMAAACATVITATGAWVFVTSSASTERDPFHFAAVMAANAEVRTAQVQTPIPRHPLVGMSLCAGPARPGATCPCAGEAETKDGLAAHAYPGLRVLF
jgi:hypothetical protein